MSENFKSTFYDAKEKKWVVDERLEKWTRERLILTAKLGEVYLLTLSLPENESVIKRRDELVKLIREHEKRRPT